MQNEIYSLHTALSSFSSHRTRPGRCTTTGTDDLPHRRRRPVGRSSVMRDGGEGILAPGPLARQWRSTWHTPPRLALQWGATQPRCAIIRPSRTLLGRW